MQFASSQRNKILACRPLRHPSHHRALSWLRISVIARLCPSQTPPMMEKTWAAHAEQPLALPQQSLPHPTKQKVFKKIKIKEEKQKPNK